MQILINIILSGAIYLLVALSFMLIYYSAKFLNISHAIILTISAYISFSIQQLNISLFIVIPLAIIITILIGISLEIIVFRNLRKSKNHSFVLLIASIGIYVILQNIISLIWGDETKSIRTGVVKAGNEVMGAYITDIQIIIIISCVLLFLCVVALLNITSFGRQIRAVSSNEELADIFGINSNKIILWAFVLGSGLAAIAGILVAFDTDITPTMGFNLLIYGIVAMIIGGVGSTWGLVGGAFLLATAQHLGAYYIDSKWMDAIAYIILILFLIWKPLGFSGKRLKKIEI